jgi:hypothetical protein
MSSSGMKRKGRKHLPKVGTRPAMEQQLEDRRTQALHPFSEDPWRRGTSTSWILAAVVAVILIIAVIAVIAAT